MSIIIERFNKIKFNIDLLKPKKPTKAEMAQARKDAKAAKLKEEAEAKAAKESAERTPEDDIEDQFSDEQIVGMISVKLILSALSAIK